MAIINIRESTVQAIITSAILNADGDYDKPTELKGNLYRCHAERRTDHFGGYVSAEWENRSDGESFSYRYKLYVDNIPSDIFEGTQVELTLKDGTKERLRVRGLRYYNFSYQLWLGL